MLYSGINEALGTSNACRLGKSLTYISWFSEHNKQTPPSYENDIQQCNL